MDAAGGGISRSEPAKGNVVYRPASDAPAISWLGLPPAFVLCLLFSRLPRTYIPHPYVQIRIISPILA